MEKPVPNKHSRRYSTGNLMLELTGYEDVLSRYLSAPTPSCHDNCKPHAPGSDHPNQTKPTRKRLNKGDVESLHGIKKPFAPIPKSPTRHAKIFSTQLAKHQVKSQPIEFKTYEFKSRSNSRSKFAESDPFYIPPTRITRRYSDANLPTDSLGGVHVSSTSGRLINCKRYDKKSDSRKDVKQVNYVIKPPDGKPTKSDVKTPNVKPIRYDVKTYGVKQPNVKPTRSDVKTPDDKPLKSDVKTPDVKLPGVKPTKSNVKTPDVKTPDVKLPGVKPTKSNVKTPDVKTPNVNTPDVNTPDVKPLKSDVKTPDVVKMLGDGTNSKKVQTLKTIYGSTKLGVDHDSKKSKSKVPVGEVVQENRNNNKSQIEERVPQNGAQIKNPTLVQKQLANENEEVASQNLKFKHGKVIGSQSETDGPTKLKFAKGEVLDENKTERDPVSVVLKQCDMEEKKVSTRLNNVIEETAGRLIKTKKSKVQALVGAFEMISTNEI